MLQSSRIFESLQSSPRNKGICFGNQRSCTPWAHLIYQIFLPNGIFGSIKCEPQNNDKCKRIQNSYTPWVICLHVVVQGDNTVPVFQIHVIPLSGNAPFLKYRTFPRIWQRQYIGVRDAIEDLKRHLNFPSRNLRVLWFPKITNLLIHHELNIQCMIKGIIEVCSGEITESICFDK